ncbi:hypothetical protein H696_02453 [Fonticula alba]|uniref:SBDS family rRNA metabolism protein n=1 Tax=Fonticula alba TaxID=691883 RepID=A0A058ZAT6_FONAL|nr:hypothetical protein H696_02453 [Fonticula alba]KCV71509.1 hypothetical protein H696_02453 [Fonticula alba]|eukprot:XP_009494632.1 hypothetical protein H696_02453 [Fonticula alba]
MFTPMNQIRLTNVSIVRLRKGGIRFEIACYKNKVMEWRNRVETNIDNVLQIDNVFLNVSRGTVPNKEQLMKAFKTDDVKKIILEILEKGEFQVAERERQQHSENLSREVAQMVSDMCINPETNRPYPVTMIQKAMTSAKFTPKANAGGSASSSTNAVKQQALEAIRTLRTSGVLPISRAQMRVSVTMDSARDAKRLMEKIRPLFSSIESEDYSSDFQLTALIDPGAFGPLNDTLNQETRGQVQLKFLSLREVREGEERIQ